MDPGVGAGLSQFIAWWLVGWVKVLAQQRVCSTPALRHLFNYVLPPHLSALYGPTGAVTGVSFPV